MSWQGVRACTELKQQVSECTNNIVAKRNDTTTVLSNVKKCQVSFRNTLGVEDCCQVDTSCFPNSSCCSSQQVFSYLVCPGPRFYCKRVPSSVTAASRSCSESVFRLQRLQSVSSCDGWFALRVCILEASASPLPPNVGGMKCAPSIKFQHELRPSISRGNRCHQRAQLSNCK